MPIVHSVVPEADSHVYMPVLQQVAHHLVNSINIQEYIKNNILIETGWTTPKGTRKNHAFFTRTNTLKITAEQSSFMSPVFEMQSFEFAPGYRNNYAEVAKTHYYPLIEDNTAEIYLWESKLPASFTLNCSLWFNSRNVAYETIKRMFYRFTQGEIYTLSVAYDYPVPKDIISALFNLYKLRKFDIYDWQFAEFFKDTEERTKELSFRDWLSVTARVRFVTTKHRARADKELCINKIIDNALIQVDMDQGKPEEIKVNNVPEVYSIPFTVKIQFEESSAVVLKYPVIIDSTQLSTQFIPHVRHNDTPIASQWPRYSNLLWNGTYHIHSAVHQFPSGAIRIPYYDDWKVPWNHLFSKSYRPFFISLFSADVDKDVLQLDLKDVLYEDIRLKEFVLQTLKEQGNDTFRSDVFFNITSYSREAIQATTDISLSDDLVLTIKAKDIHPQRHLVFYELTDFRYLNPKYWEYFKNHLKEFGFDPDNSNDKQYINAITGGGSHGTVRAYRIFNSKLIPRFRKGSGSSS